MSEYAICGSCFQRLGAVKELEAEIARLNEHNLELVRVGSKHSRRIITGQAAEIIKLSKQVGFYKCCMLSGEIGEYTEPATEGGR